MADKRCKHDQPTATATGIDVIKQGKLRSVPREFGCIVLANAIAIAIFLTAFPTGASFDIFEEPTCHVVAAEPRGCVRKL